MYPSQGSVSLFADHLISHFVAKQMMTSVHSSKSNKPFDLKLRVVAIKEVLNEISAKRATILRIFTLFSWQGQVIGMSMFGHKLDQVANSQADDLLETQWLHIFNFKDLQNQ